jgi:hypothetical protein
VIVWVSCSFIWNTNIVFSRPPVPYIRFSAYPLFVIPSPYNKVETDLGVKNMKTVGAKFCSGTFILIKKQ